MPTINVMHFRSCKGLKKPAGPEKYISSLLRYIDPSTFNVVLAVSADAAFPTDSFLKAVGNGRIRTELLKAGTKLDLFRIAAKLVRLLKKYRIHILHSHEYKSDVLALITSMFADVALVTSAHGWLKGSVKLKSYEALDAFIIRFFDRILVGSKAMEQELISKGIPREKITLIYNAVDISGYTTDMTGGGIREEFNIEEDIPIVGTVGRLSPEKGHQFFLQAAAKVVKVRPQTKFLIAGNGPLKCEIQSMARKLGLENKVVLTDFYDDLNKALAGMDIFVLSSITESLPLVLLEAMSVGKPIVATAVGGIPEVIEHNKTGIIVQPTNSSQMAKAILRLLENKNEALQMGKTSRQLVAEKFSARDMCRKIEQVYLGLTEKTFG